MGFILVRIYILASKEIIRGTLIRVVLQIDPGSFNAKINVLFTPFKTICWR
jgi:hypothetical protein